MLSEGGAIYTYMQPQEINGLCSRLRMPAQLRGEPVDALQTIRHQSNSRYFRKRPIAGLLLQASPSTPTPMFASELGNQLAEQSVLLP